jgi:hypothetical protein
MRDVEVERLGGLEVDNELVLYRYLYRQIGQRLALAWKQIFSSYEWHRHRRSLQSVGFAEKFACAGPNDLHAKAKQDKRSESDENVGAHGSKQSLNSV